MTSDLQRVEVSWFIGRRPAGNSGVVCLRREEMGECDMQDDSEMSSLPLSLRHVKTTKCHTHQNSFSHNQLKHVLINAIDFWQTIQQSTDKTNVLFVIKPDEGDIMNEEDDNTYRHRVFKFGCLF